MYNDSSKATYETEHISHMNESHLTYVLSLRSHMSQMWLIHMTLSESLDSWVIVARHISQMRLINMTYQTLYIWMSHITHRVECVIGVTQEWRDSYLISRLAAMTQSRLWRSHVDIRHVYDTIRSTVSQPWLCHGSTSTCVTCKTRSRLCHRRDERRRDCVTHATVS